MTNKVTNKDEFEKSRSEKIFSGCVKFSRSYVSDFQLFIAAKKMVETIPNVTRASIRGGGSNQVALDFAYDFSVDGEKAKINFEEVLYKKLQPFFAEVLGGDYMLGWDFANPTTVVK